MKTILLLSACVFCVGCAVNRKQAAAIAVREVARPKMPLPNNYTPQINAGKGYVDFEPTVASWVATFSAPSRKRLYVIGIDQRNGTIRGFTDYRDLRPHRF